MSDVGACRPGGGRMINRGRWLRWAYENLNEVDYLRALKAVRADQGEETPRASRSDASWPAGEEQ